VISPFHAHVRARVECRRIVSDVALDSSKGTARGYLLATTEKAATVATTATRDRGNVAAVADVAAAQEYDGDGGGFQGVGTTRSSGERAESGAVG